LEIIKSRNPKVLLPIGVDTTVPIAFYKQKFIPTIKVPIADYNTMLKAHDKSITMKIAHENNIPIPKTYFPESIDEALKFAEKLGYPVVIKRRKGSGVEKGVRIARSRKDLLHKYQEIEHMPCDSLVEEQKHPLLQEYIPGEIRDVCVLYNKGDIRAALTQRRVWTWPPRGGPGQVNETIDDPQIKNHALRLMNELGWHGLAQVEFKLDAEGKPRLMEINPKFWGTLELSIKAGIDFPSMLHQMAINGDVKPNFVYKKNLTILWIFPYVMRYLAKAPNRLHNLRQFLKWGFSKNTVTDFSLLDIKPEIIKFMGFFAAEIF
jgi:predicted ATP-grasp superfamily ATP-dependent carboligase